MKKFFLVALALLIALCAVACSSGKKDDEAVDETEDEGADENIFEDSYGSFEYQLNAEGKCEITKYSPNSVAVVDVKLPETLDNRDVAGIAAGAFKADNSIKSLTVPACYTYIGDYAFYDCDSLESVKFEGNALTSIGNGTFEGCGKLANINFPVSVKEVGKFAFKDCTALVSVDLSGATVIGDGAFLSCSALKSVKISDAVEEISKNCFYGCDSLEYTVENGGLYLGNEENEYAVLVSAEDLDIETCVVNPATKMIADQAFLNCTMLRTLTLGESIVRISAACFENCSDLEFNELENGYYLGTAENPYMVLMGMIDQSQEDFTLSTYAKILCDEALTNCASLQDILFAGTKEAWEAIIKTDGWNYGRTTRIVFADESIEPIIYE